DKKGNFKHLALSLPDTWRITPDSHFEKKVDIIIGIGRNSPVMDGFLKRYIAEHPDMTYASPVMEDGKRVFYSNKGEYLGLSKTREDYKNIIRKARCFIYTTPGIDGGEVRSKGYNQVTPRFLEHISAGCNPVLRYKANPDTDFYELEKFCQSINTYEEFAAVMDRARSIPADMAAVSEYLEKHYTSTRVKELNELLK
ncbi:MAG: glycosyltransferase family 1 protein, partial [Akkermansia sp.]|nr:glycosyltransferase family 1 protein [Akkermansia sp.]